MKKRFLIILFTMAISMSLYACNKNTNETASNDVQNQPTETATQEETTTQEESSTEIETTTQEESSTETESTAQEESSTEIETTTQEESSTETESTAQQSKAIDEKGVENVDINVVVTPVIEPTVEVSTEASTQQPSSTNDSGTTVWTDPETGRTITVRKGSGNDGDLKDNKDYSGSEYDWMRNIEIE